MSGGQYLIVRLAAIGDVVMMSTLVREIRRRDHQAHITWLCGRVAQPLVELFEVDEVIAVDEADLLQGKPVRRVRAVLDVWRRLRRRSFDQTLLGYADRRYRLLLAPVRTGRVRALEHATSPRMLPVPGRYFGDECVRLLDEEDSRGPIAGHFPLAEVRRSLAAPERPGDIGVVLGPGGARNA